MPPKDDTVETATVESRQPHSSSSSDPMLLLPKSDPTILLEVEMDNLDTLERRCVALVAPESTPTGHRRQKKTVSFNSIVIIHDVSHLNDLDTQIRNDLWYTATYLQMMRCNMLPDDEDEDDDAQSTSSNDIALASYMRSRNVRRGRQLVMAEQARQNRRNPAGARDVSRIHEEYCRVAISCQEEASKRGRMMAAQASKMQNTVSI
jgi:hypothetical protein